MRILVLGAQGQIGWELVRALQPQGEVIGLTRADADLARPAQLRDVVRRAAPQVIFNAAAYTDVDGAEDDAAQAFAVNQDAVELLAAEAAARGALLVHFSTDYVFSGESSLPYTEDDAPAPLNVYGHSKLGGELALRASRADWLCLRVSWVYSLRRRCFLTTVLRRLAQGLPVDAPDDQIGAPTWSRMIAEACAMILPQTCRERSAGEFASELLHLAAAGQTSRRGWAEAVAGHTLTAPMPMAMQTALHALDELDHADRLSQSLAQRPQSSRLACGRMKTRYGVRLPDWQLSMQRCLIQVAGETGL
ncbi:MAG: dTDP-4-dehydrorhamnose reductase [Betaproteobacteria bacterium]